jgi:hypothetical protein
MSVFLVGCAPCRSDFNLAMLFRFDAFRQTLLQHGNERSLYDASM